MLRVAYEGTSGPLFSIDQKGFALVAMHVWPAHLSWGAYTGDCGPNFVGLALSSGIYLLDDPEIGTVAHGGNLIVDRDTATVVPRDPVKQRIFVASLEWEVKIDAGVIQSFSYSSTAKTVAITIGQLEGGLMAAAAVVWVTQGDRGTAAQPGGDTATVTASGQNVTSMKGGTQAAVSSEPVVVLISA